MSDTAPASPQDLEDGINTDVPALTHSADIALPCVTVSPPLPTHKLTHGSGPGIASTSSMGSVPPSQSTHKMAPTRSELLPSLPGPTAVSDSMDTIAAGLSAVGIDPRLTGTAVESDSTEELTRSQDGKASLTDAVLSIWKRKIQPGRAGPAELRIAADQLSTRLRQSGGCGLASASVTGTAQGGDQRWSIQVVDAVVGAPGVWKRKTVSLVIWVPAGPDVMASQSHGVEVQEDRRYVWAGEIRTHIFVEGPRAGEAEGLAWRFGLALSRSPEDWDDWRVVHAKQIFTLAPAIPGGQKLWREGTGSPKASVLMMKLAGEATLTSPTVLEMSLRAVKFALGEEYRPSGEELGDRLGRVQARLDARGRGKKGEEGVYLAVRLNFVRNRKLNHSKSEMASGGDGDHGDVRGTLGPGATSQDKAVNKDKTDRIIISPSAIVSISLRPEISGKIPVSTDQKNQGTMPKEEPFAVIVIDGRPNGQVGIMGVMYHGEYPVMHIYGKRSPPPRKEPARG